MKRAARMKSPAANEVLLRNDKERFMKNRDIAQAGGEIHCASSAFCNEARCAHEVACG
ncbi:MAG: hypothetical protein IJD82_07995 [Clostridia bacterium]|nr:hypothetical protein [Clostridia bacterium]